LWIGFEKQWAKMLLRFGVPYFHMVEFAHFKGPFKGWQKREEDRRALIREAVSIIKEFTWGSFAAAVLVEDWTKCNQLYQMEEGGFFPYPLCGWTCIDHVRRWCLGENLRHTKYPFSNVLFFFERGDPDHGHLSRLAERDFKKLLEFQDKIPIDGSPPIGAYQAADFAAWHVRNAMGKFESGKLERFREDFELLFSSMEWQQHHADFSMTRIADRPQSPFIRITNDDPRWDEEPSLIRFCQDVNIPKRNEPPKG